MKEALSMVGEMVASLQRSELNLLKSRLAKHLVYYFDENNLPKVAALAKGGSEAGFIEIYGVQLISEGKEVCFIGEHSQLLDLSPSDIFAGHMSKITAMIL